MSGINLNVQKGKEFTWSQFKKRFPPYSIAADGLVTTESVFDPTGPRANFDHHKTVHPFFKGFSLTDRDLYRSVTNSSSEQVRMAINGGLFQAFREEGKPRAEVYVNDADEDVCLFWWNTKNHEIVNNHASSAINRLTFYNNLLDMAGGTYPFGDTSMYRKTLWVFQPYKEAKRNGTLNDLDSAGLKSIIEAVSARISEHVHNGGEEFALDDTRYEVIDAGPGWSMVVENNLADRMFMARDGIFSFISYMGQTGENHRYVLGHMSPYHRAFSNLDLCSYLNKVESDIVTVENKWGGSDEWGGSPRLTGSKLPPKDLRDLVVEYQSKHK